MPLQDTVFRIMVLLVGVFWLVGVFLLRGTWNVFKQL